MKIKRKARVFNIERCATEDGPGIRTVVFLKGCLLKCKWCANPESQLFIKEVLFKNTCCIDCEKCVSLCPKNAISKIDGYGFITDSAICNNCKLCIDNCYSDARVMMGEDLTVEQLMEELDKDALYYEKSGGGITFSGGEPLLYAEFIDECVDEIHNRGWTALIETCGEISREQLEVGAKKADIIYCDCKHMSSEKHEKYTGKSNEGIIQNIKWLDENFKGELVIRYPFIPGFNDRPEDIEAFLDFASSLKSVEKVVFLPFHRLGLDKYIGLGREYEMGGITSLKKQDLNFIDKYNKVYDLDIIIQ